MTTNPTETYTYERLDIELSAISPAAQDAEPQSRPRTPGLLWAGGVLFAVNMLIVFCIWLSPELRVNMYGEDAEHSSVYFRPSPLTETVQLAKAVKPKQPEKVRPVFYEEPQFDLMESADLLLPRSTQSTMAASAASSSLTVHRPEQPVSGERVHKVVESYSEFPRMTASLTTSRVTEPAHVGTVDIASRAVTERAATHVVINH